MIVSALAILKHHKITSASSVYSVLQGMGFFFFFLE